MLKFSGSVIWRLGTRAIPRNYSSSSAPVIKADKLNPNDDVTIKSAKTKDDDIQNSGLVAAAFAHLTSPDPPEGQKRAQVPSPKSVKPNKNQQIDAQIANASNIASLLLVAENAIVSRRHALKMVSILSEWSSSNKVQISDFEKDPRFLKLCRILARTPTAHAMSSLNVADDLSTVLGITGDDEAARLITNLTLPQMVKVMKALHQKGRRSTPLLRALAHNIVKQPEVIDLKKSADLLFSMASLNFPDPVLLDKICHDVITLLPTNSDKPAVVTSIMVSLGLMRYRHQDCLSALAAWMQEHSEVTRSSDLAAAAQTLATLDYVPREAEPLLRAIDKLQEEDLRAPSSWLELVFSLLVLGRASERRLRSTLSAGFIETLLAAGEIPIPARRKLITIDAYISLAYPNYTGPRLPEEIPVGVPIVYTKEKSLYVQSVMDTFRSLVSAEGFLKKDCNSNMGFLFDAELALDAKCHPVSLQKAANNKSVFRIAVLCLDYHDMCRKTAAPLGVNQLYTKLLQMKGYKVLQIPYTEYNPKDKLVTRVQYIEKRLKDLVSDKRAS
ncbi:unnamed protein product [Plutella xylostella]|uniref:(diamondback moth) hypothetical protein n=1 Tax=Plutella xylostella TaxID=51655 RepID=A0A8S4EYN5_PLUXY|nr:unnamed protein product [Plutella xylostella]